MPSTLRYSFCTVDWKFRELKQKVHRKCEKVQTVISELLAVKSASFKKSCGWTHTKVVHKELFINLFRQKCVSSNVVYSKLHSTTYFSTKLPNRFKHLSQHETGFAQPPCGIAANVLSHSETVVLISSFSTLMHLKIHSTLKKDETHL